VKAVWIARNVKRQVQTHRGLALAAVVVFCLLALVTGGAKLGARTVARWGAVIGQNIHAIVYLAEDVDQERAAGLAEILKRSGSVAQVAVIEPAQALARLVSASKSNGVDAKTLENLDPSYFPRSLEVSLIPAADLTDRAGDLAKRLRGVPGILQVDAMSDGLARLSVWVRLGRSLGIGMLSVLSLFVLGTLLVLFLRSRSAVAERAFVLGQLGETPTAIRLPAGLWMAGAALVGWAVGLIVLAIAWKPLLVRLERSLGITTDLPLALFDRSEMVTGFVLVLLLGLLMGYFATPLPRLANHA
jgi:cell division protein FtsX